MRERERESLQNGTWQACPERGTFQKNVVLVVSKDKKSNLLFSLDRNVASEWNIFSVKLIFIIFSTTFPF